MSPLNTFPRVVDVLIVGGGPTGLVTAHILVQAGLKVLVVEQYNAPGQALYGRAAILYAGSLEFLDTIGIYNRIASIGYIVTDSLTFKDGKEIHGRGWKPFVKAMAGNTYFEHCLSIRQKYVEEAVRTAISAVDPTAVQAPAKLVDFTIDNSFDHSVIATVEAGENCIEVRSKYILGADGGRSTVRELSKIQFPGTPGKFKWVRLDAIVQSDLPRMTTAIESTSYGHVLWMPIDNGATRIGFVCSDALYGEKGENITAELVMEEAKKAVAPFKLEFVTLAWWTVFQFGQRVAERYQDGPVILAGDAAHTHSSGAAQGMNTGLCDAANLGWKLAGVLRGWFKDEILDTYTSERKASAEHLIQLDRDVSTLISGTIPDHFCAPPGADPNIYLQQVFSASADFTVGLGVSYSENLVNVARETDAVLAAGLRVGHRVRDVPLFRPGAAFPTRLLELTPYIGKLWVFILAGEVEKTPEGVRLNQKCAAKYRALRKSLDSPGSFTRTLAPAFDFITILRGTGVLQPAETLGTQLIGTVAYDQTGDAYDKYGVATTEGALVVLRPDAIISFIAPLDGALELGRYLSRLVRSVEASVAMEEQLVTTLGEIALDDRNEGELIRIPMMQVQSVDNPSL
ncbi:FAD binding domain-containing protein [Sparassis latifolia]